MALDLNAVDKRDRFCGMSAVAFCERNINQGFEGGLDRVDELIGQRYK